MKTLTDTVRDDLLDVWRPQACQNPAHWPDMLARLLAGREITGREEAKGVDPGRLLKRTTGNYAERVNSAVAELTRAFADGAPDNPTHVVWRAFPMFTKASATELAVRLMRRIGMSDEAIRGAFEAKQAA